MLGSAERVVGATTAAQGSSAGHLSGGPTTAHQRQRELELEAWGRRRRRRAPPHLTWAARAGGQFGELTPRASRVPRRRRRLPANAMYLP